MAHTPRDYAVASKEAMELCQTIMTYQPASSDLTPEAFEAVVLKLLQVHDDDLVPVALTTDASDAAAVDALLAGLRGVATALATGCSHLPTNDTWKRVIHTFVMGASHPALPVMGRAFIAKCISDFVPWDSVEAAAADAQAAALAVGRRGDVAAAGLVQVAVAAHQQATATSAAITEADHRQLERVTCAGLQKLPAASSEAVATALVAHLPASLDVSVLLIGSPGTTTETFKALEAALAGAHPQPTNAADVAAPDVVAARARLTQALQERFADYGAVAAQKWCNALLATSTASLFASLRSVEAHVTLVVEPLGAVCRKAQHRDPRRASSKSADSIIADSVPVTYLCARFAALAEWLTRELAREGSTQRGECAAAAVRLARGYADLSAFTRAAPRQNAHKASAGADVGAGAAEGVEEEEQSSAESRLAALIPSEAELETALSPLARVVEQAEARERERYARRHGETAPNTSAQASSAETSSDAASASSSSSSSSSSSDDDDDECENGNDDDVPVPAVMDLPLEMLECHLLLVSRLQPFVQLTATTAPAAAAAEAASEATTTTAAGKARPPRTVPSQRMLTLAHTARILYEHVLPPLKNILSLQKTASAGAAKPAAKPTNEEAADDQAEAAAAVRAEQAKATPVLESLCRLCVSLWHATRTTRHHRAARGAPCTPSWRAPPAAEKVPRKDSQRGRDEGRGRSGAHHGGGGGGGRGGRGDRRRENRKRPRH